MLIVVVAGCSKAPVRAPNSDTVALLESVVKYAATSLKVGPRVMIARTTKSTPSIRLTGATQAALVGMDSTRSSVERYDIAHQVCDTVAKVSAFCRLENADGLLAVLGIEMWRDSAKVGIEYYTTDEITSLGAVDPKLNAKVKGKKVLVYNAGDASVARDVNGHWQVKHFTEMPMGDGTRGSAKPK